METLDVTLGGRSYPLTLSPEEVETVRAAAQAVEAQIAQLKSQYAITDRIDLMAMAALANCRSSRNPRTVPFFCSERKVQAPTWPADQVEDLLQRIHAALEG